MNDLAAFLYLKTNGGSVRPFFEKLNITEIAIYGTGVFAGYFYNEAIACGIKVKYCIDQEPKYFNGLPVYSPLTVVGMMDEEARNVDAVMVCSTSQDSYNTASSIYSCPVWIAHGIIDLCVYTQVILPYLKDTIKKVYFFDFPSSWHFRDQTAVDAFLSTQYAGAHEKKLQNPEYFKLIYKDVDEYSDEYIRSVFTQSPLIKKKGGLVHADIASRYVNIAGGKRLTTDMPDNYKNAIHVFGECSVLGYGVDDSRTIASCLQRKLNSQADCSPRAVVNCGVWGIVSSPVYYFEQIKLQKFTLGDEVVIFSQFSPNLGHKVVISPNFSKATLDDVNKVLDDYNAIVVNLWDAFFNQRIQNPLCSLHIDSHHLSHRGMQLIAEVLCEAIARNEKPDKHLNRQIQINGNIYPPPPIF